MLLPTFHPSAALRADTTGRSENRTLKGMEEDFQTLDKLLQERRQAPPPAAPAPEPSAAPPAAVPDGPAATAEEAEPEGRQLGLF